MNKTSFFLLGMLILFIPVRVMSQKNSSSNLCIGHYYTEEEAKKVIEELKYTYKTKDEWQKRAAIIREGILKGADLYPLPDKSPLNAHYTNERKYDGYSVKNVAIESLPGVFVTVSLYLPELVENRI